MAIYRGPGGAGDATNNATSQAILAAASAVAAASSEAAAASSATSASNSATAASSSASAAASSEASVAANASNAATSATNAATSATAAANSASAASTSETNAASSASAAATSATNAANSATSAANSATAAASSATAAAGSATSAAGSAAAAASSASDAADSAVDAQSSEDAAAAYAASINPANFLTKANNLSDLTNTSTARNNLGVAIGTDVQAYSAELQAISNGGGNAMFKNRIINGAMMIDQRNAGAVGTYYIVDRFRVDQTSFGQEYSRQQNKNSVTPPSGFKNYAGIQVTTAATPTGNQISLIAQPVEVCNMYDLNWGTANASAVTLSFWVNTSITGLHSGAVYDNVNANKSYVFTFTVNSANTWEYKTVTIPGPTSGSWNTTVNGMGFVLGFCLGSSGTWQGTPNTWTTGSIPIGATGSVNVCATLNATFYITGVQLEKGSTATSFDYRPYGTELALCQRYYETGTTKMYLNILATIMATATEYKVTKRAAATLVYSNPPAGGYAPPTTQEWSNINGFAGNRDSTSELAYSWAASAEL